VVNTNLAILQELKSQFGGYLCKLTHRREGWKPSWSWCLTSRAAVKFLTELEPYLRIKQEQVWLVWGWDFIRPNTPGPGRGKKWSNWDNDETKEAMDLIVDQAHWLNQKGPQTRSEPMALALGQLYI